MCNRFYNEIKTLLVIMYMLSLIGFLQTQTIIGRWIKFIFNHILQNRSQKWTISPKNTLFHPYPSKYPYFNISISIKKEEKTSSLKPTIKVPLEGMKSGGASFVCRHTRESISYLPKPSDPGQIIDIISNIPISMLFLRCPQLGQTYCW